MNPPPPSPRTRMAVGIDENGGTPILVSALRQGRHVSISKTSASELTRGTLLAACLLQRESFTRWLTAPIASSKKAETVFHSLLDIQLPFSVEDCQVSLLRMTPTADRTGTRGLVAGARGSDISKRLESLAAMGCDPHLLDQEGIALWSQGMEEVPPAEGSAPARIVVYLGADRVVLSIGLDNEFITSHTLRQVDPESIHRLLKSTLPSSPASTLWIWAGPGACSVSVVESHYAALKARWPGTMKVMKEPETFLARALATRALTAGPDRCNLRTGPFLHLDLARRQAKLPYRWAASCLAAGVLLCLVNLVWLACSHFRLSQIQHTITTLAIEATGSPRGLPPGQEVLATRRAVESRTREMEPFLAACETPLRATLHTLLSTAHEEGVAIESMTLGMKNGAIHGLAPKLAQGEKMAQRLNGGGWATTFERKEAALGDERTAFVIGMGRTREKK